MKKFVVIISCLFLFSIPSVEYAYTSGFLYMINAMNIPIKNVNGLDINEEIYNKYRLIVYGNPLIVNDERQRWKDSNIGNMSDSGKLWDETGRRGEYWILGQDYYGKSVHNEIFPDDYNSGTSPVNWNYKNVKGAEESWNDTSKFLYPEQKEYMLNQNLSRFGTVYDITAQKIGLKKARLENAATWGSAGSIYTEKPGIGNTIWVATFSVPPMAGNAELNSILNIPNGLEYTIEANQNEVEIPFDFGATIYGLSEYAKPEHIKNIKSQLKVNNVTKDEIAGTQTININKNGNIVINRNDYKDINKVVLNFECNSLMETFFPTDPVFYASKTVTVTINIITDSKNQAKIRNDEEAPSIYSVTLKRISVDKKENSKDLYLNRKTGRQFICAGQVLEITVRTSTDAKNVIFDFSGSNSIRELDNLTKKFLYEEPKTREKGVEKYSLNSLNELYDFPKSLKLDSENMYEKCFKSTYVIPYETIQTIHTWDSLRKNKQSAFEIDESKLFKSIKSPYTLVVSARSMQGVRTKRVSFDVAERWDTLYNRDISMYVSN